MRLRFLVPMLSVVTGSFLVAACTTDDPSGSAGDGGAGGEATTPGEGGSGGAGATPGSSGAAGDVGAGGDCATDGSGTLVIEVTGLPEGVAPDIDIAGPDELNVTEAGELSGVDAGSYTVTADRVFDEDPIVRTVFEGKVTTPSLCLADGGSSTIKVEYRAIPTSNKLWLPTGLGDGDTGVAFASEELAESATTAATLGIAGDFGKSVAFDRDGNLWTLGTNADVRRYSAASLSSSGAKVPDVSFSLPEIDCVPGLSSIALDASGNLWLSSSCAGQVVRVPAEELTGTDVEKESDVLIAGITGAEGLAFDSSGNLWVANGVNLLRYDASRLGEPTGDAADLTLLVNDDGGELLPAYIAFDKAGNLWSVPLTGPLFQVAAADLDGTDTEAAVEVDANVSIALDVNALPHQPAFDDGNGLWLSWTDGKLARLGPVQLGTSVGAGSPVSPSVIIESPSVGGLLPVAFYPAPQGLPLYHSIPEE